MPHKTEETVGSLLEIFDPDKYQGIRDHFSQGELTKIDALRANHAHVTTLDKLFIIAMDSKALFLGEDD